MTENLNVTLVEGHPVLRYKCNGCGSAFNERGIRAHQSHRHQCMACRPIWKSLRIGDQVRHADRAEAGSIVQRVAAWTPNELTTHAPDAGMVQVKWNGECQAHWEYYAELVRA
ncbi:hypothetical protein H7J87_11680 [Mycolicibacterium wolinskyi]|uniref:C2H2-type domain-containing protein n=1 Tax=Mycolicibacterium wolinskyi TaxID=59750 RepID=A0A1X2FJ04_9MYCO|nr:MULTISPECIES: hypothetical protein [Mycolicibacterium]MCV7285990.1 hypothetical protein [Mycolicibacterium wolinskyi]MCV7296186.1 hypothetical protein [Mycolicibacterium goodii]ORX18420.1 hypothetical protein AWC31_14035 [Mycolicibacterium wolinskyi]